MSAEQMQRAAYTARDAADKISQAAGTIDELTHRLTLLFGEGYGNNVERLIEALDRDEAHRADLAAARAESAMYQSHRNTLLAALVKVRADWIAENDPRDGTDCVTPFDVLLYLPASCPGEATGVPRA